MWTSDLFLKKIPQKISTTSDHLQQVEDYMSTVLQF
jgi:hypothetical protein